MIEKKTMRFIVVLCAVTIPVLADEENDKDGQAQCDELPTNTQWKALLVAAPNSGGDAGAIPWGSYVGAVLDRSARVCSLAASMDDPIQVWPGSQANPACGFTCA